MYEWQCPNCGWDGQLTDEAQAAAVVEADKLQATHHIEHCPRCQWVVRIPVDLLRTTVLAVRVAPTVRRLRRTEDVDQPRTTMMAAPSAKKPAAKKTSVKKVAAKKPTAKKAMAKKKPAAKKPAAKRKK